MGGSTIGYERAGFDVRLGVDLWDQAAEWHRRNLPGRRVLEASVLGLSAARVLREAGLPAGGLDVLDGSPPCQGFSGANHGANRLTDIEKLRDPRNGLPAVWARLAAELRPRAVIMENVARMSVPLFAPVLREVRDVLRGAGYALSAGVISAADYGVPQTRPRFYLLGVRGGPPPGLPPPTVSRHLTCSEALRDVPELDGPIKPAGGSRHISWRTAGPGRPVHPAWKSVKRLDPGRPSFTITASFTPMHWKYNRHLSRAETLRIMSFPGDFLLPESGSLALRLVGNSVPPPMAEAVGRHVIRALGGNA